jgi:hypothetical protein
VAQTPTDSLLTTSVRIYDLLRANAVSLGLQGPDGKINVWFGDQGTLPETPAVCVEPGTKTRDLSGVPDMTTNLFDVHIFLYHSAVGGEQQQARRDTIDFAEDIERFLHVNHLNLANSLGDQIIIHGYVKSMDAGYQYKNGTTLYNAVHMIWTGMTKTSLRNASNPIP